MRVVMQAKSMAELKRIFDETNKQTQILWAERENAKSKEKK